MHNSTRISLRNVGQCDPGNWLKEGDGLYASSHKTREIWQEHRKQFSNNINVQSLGQDKATSDLSLLTGLPRASMLLLGYAVEMYLKAAVVKAYRGCRNSMFERDVKSRYGHNFNRMAEEIAFLLQPSDERSFDSLKNMVLVDARYPVFVPEGQSNANTVNQQTRRMWSDENYTMFSSLAKRVREHASRIDNDNSNPSTFVSYNIDSDGYLTLRINGHLPPRITFRFSTVMLESGNTSASDVKALFVQENPLLDCYWDRAWICQDGDNRTLNLQKPSAA